MSNGQPNNLNESNSSTGTTIALMLIWGLTLLVTQTAIWLTARILDNADAVANNLTWGQAGILSFVWVFTKTWHKAITSTKQG